MSKRAKLPRDWEAFARPSQPSPPSRLVLSCFSGMGALDEGFRRAGFCVVSAGDVAWSTLYDLRGFHPPRGVFDGVIGGDPCQSHSALSNLVRAKGLEPTFPDMTPELQRVIEEARPRWFLRENVPRAPEIKPAGYSVRSFLLDHATLDAGDGVGHEQQRRRRFWFGRSSACDGCNTSSTQCDGDSRPCCPDCRHVRDAPELRAHINFAFTVLPETAITVDAGHDYIDGAKGLRRNSVCGDPRSSFIPGGRAEVAALKIRKQAVSGRNSSQGMGGTPGETPGNHAGNPPRYSLEEMLDLQGLPRDCLEHSPLTMAGKRKLVGNAVPLPMATALGRAVMKATRE